MIVALYRPLATDPASGPIVQTLETQADAVPAAAKAMGLSWVEFTSSAADRLMVAARLDSTHSVQGGKLVANPTVTGGTTASAKVAITKG